MISKTYKTEAVVIKRINFSETDKIITFYSKDYGKFKALAKGIRRLTSRKAGILDLFNQVEIFLVKGKTLDLVSEALLLSDNQKWKRDFERISLAYQFCEIIDKLTGEGQSSLAIYNLLIESLNYLGELKEKAEKDKLLLNFKKKFLLLSGFGLPTRGEDANLNMFIENISQKRINSFSLLKEDLFKK